MARTKGSFSNVKSVIKKSNRKTMPFPFGLGKCSATDCKNCGDREVVFVSSTCLNFIDHGKRPHEKLIQAAEQGRLKGHLKDLAEKKTRIEMNKALDKLWELMEKWDKDDFQSY